MNANKIVLGAATALTAVGSALAAYTPDYTSSDMSAAAIDVVGNGLVESKNYVGLFIFVGAFTLLASGVAGLVAKFRGY